MLQWVRDICIMGSLRENSYFGNTLRVCCGRRKTISVAYGVTWSRYHVLGSAEVANGRLLMASTLAFLLLLQYTAQNTLFNYRNQKPLNCCLSTPCIRSKKTPLVVAHLILHSSLFHLFPSLLPFPPTVPLSMLPQMRSILYAVAQPKPLPQV